MANGKPATRRKAAPKQARQPLEDRTNVRSGAEDYDDDVTEKPKPKRARTTAARKPQSKKVETLGVIPETQPDPDRAEDAEQSVEIDPENMDITQAPTPKQIQRFVQRPRSASVQPLPPRASARSVSAQPAHLPPRERSGSASGNERERRGADPELRRKLNDVTKKYENLNLKYQNLQEIGKNNAESNFEKLKRASDDKTKTANELIASLKKEIAELRKASTTGNSESAGLQKQVTSLTSSKEKLTNDAVTLKEKLQTSQNEVKSLEAKLVAARQQTSNSSQDTKTPAAQTRSLPANTSEAQKEAKMKENLYTDLTGLIIRGVKRKDGEDEFDCIQTGRNGSKSYLNNPPCAITNGCAALHFHLLVANDSSTQNPKTPSGLSYEEAEFAYIPFLDASRDRDLLDILPDYLTEEIYFPRNHAVKFYTKVAESMTKKIVVEAESEEG